MRKRWRDFTWTPVVPRGAWALCAFCWSHFQSVLVFPSPPAQLVSTTDLICLQSKRRRENLLRKNGPGLWSDRGKAVINPVKKLFVAFLTCVFFSGLHHPQELWVRVTPPSGIWYKNVKNKQWKRMGSQYSASTQVLHPQIWWNLNGRCTSTRLQFFHLHTHCIQSLLYVKPCWSLHLHCRSLVPAILALLAVKLEHLPVPLPMAAMWMDSGHPVSPLLSQPWKIQADFFRPFSRKNGKKCSNVSVLF